MAIPVVRPGGGCPFEARPISVHMQGVIRNNMQNDPVDLVP